MVINGVVDSLFKGAKPILTLFDQFFMIVKEKDA